MIVRRNKSWFLRTLAGFAGIAAIGSWLLHGGSDAASPDEYLRNIRRAVGGLMVLGAVLTALSVSVQSRRCVWFTSAGVLHVRPARIVPGRSIKFREGTATLMPVVGPIFLLRAKGASKRRFRAVVSEGQLANDAAHTQRALSDWSTVRTI